MEVGRDLSYLRLAAGCAPELRPLRQFVAFRRQGSRGGRGGGRHAAGPRLQPRIPRHTTRGQCTHFALIRRGGLRRDVTGGADEGFGACFFCLFFFCFVFVFFGVFCCFFGFVFSLVV